MKCELCKFPIYKGFETTFRGNYYHPACAVEEAKIKPVPKTVHRTKQNKFRLVKGVKQ